MSPIASSLGLLTMATAAMAAVPHRGHHHYHHRVRPTGTGAPYGYANGTGIYGATGTGTGLVSASPVNLAANPVGTETVDLTSIMSITSTVTATYGNAAASGAYGNAAYGAAASDSSCAAAPAVTVTVTDSSSPVTVTVTANVSSSEAAPVYAAVANSTSAFLTYSAVNHHHSWKHYTAPGSSSSSVVAPVASSAAPSAYSAPAVVSTSSTSVAVPASTSSSSVAAPVETSSSLSAYSAPAATSSYTPSSSSVAAPVESTSSTSVYSAPASSSAAASSTSSSAAPSSTSSSSISSYAGSKRGCAYPWNGATACSLFSTDAVGWAYDWESTNNDLATSQVYVPMLKDSTSERCDSWQSNAQAAIDAGSKYLLGFNEPDNAGQANLSPETAVSLWNTHMTQFASQAYLGAPAVTSSVTAGQGLDWLSSFMSQCTDCSISFVPVHWYGYGSDIDAQVTAFQEYVAQAYAQVNMPIWVTEFAPSSDVDATQFIQAVIPWLESNATYVERYSYFDAADGSMLTGTTLNAVGNAYATAA